MTTSALPPAPPRTLVAMNPDGTVSIPFHTYVAFGSVLGTNRALEIEHRVLQMQLAQANRIIATLTRHIEEAARA